MNTMFRALGLATMLALAGMLPAAAGDAQGEEHVPQLRIGTIDGATFDLAATRGKWVVVNYWATWCSPCIKEMPDLRAFAESREDVLLIGLAYEDITVEDMRAFLAERPAGYPIAIVDVYDPPADFPAPRGLPMTWLIAPDGHIAKRFLGPVTGRDLGQAIQAHAPAGDVAG